MLVFTCSMLLQSTHNVSIEPKPKPKPDSIVVAVVAVVAVVVIVVAVVRCCIVSYSLYTYVYFMCIYKTAAATAKSQVADSCGKYTQQ